MYHHEGEAIPVFDCHVHYWDASEANVIHEGGDQFIRTFYGGHKNFTPEAQQLDFETFRDFSADRFLQDVFGRGYVDLAMFQPTYLSEFYETGFNTVERNGELKEAYPDRFVLNGHFDPRDGEDGLEYLEWQKETYDIQGVKLYTASWNGDSKGYRLDSKESFRYLEKCLDLGIENIHPHKGPTIKPLNLDAFDVMDVDETATSFPELNFVVEHSGVPRLDDFCWFAHQEQNVYATLALIAGFARVRPRKFKEIIGELLFWLGEDRIMFGSDYAIGMPGPLIEAIMETELSPAQEQEYGAAFELEAKKKFLGGNLARLYDIDLQERLARVADDELSRRFDLVDSYRDAGVAAD